MPEKPFPHGDVLKTNVFLAPITAGSEAIATNDIGTAKESTILSSDAHLTLVIDRPVNYFTTSSPISAIIDILSKRLDEDSESAIADGADFLLQTWKQKMEELGPQAQVVQIKFEPTSSEEERDYERKREGKGEKKGRKAKSVLDGAETVLQEVRKDRLVQAAKARTVDGERARRLAKSRTPREYQEAVLSDCKATAKLW